MRGGGGRECGWVGRVSTYMSTGAQVSAVRLLRGIPRLWVVTHVELFRPASTKGTQACTPTAVRDRAMQARHLQQTT